MTMGLLTEILKEVPLSTVLREKVSNLEAENEALKTENAILKDDIRELRTQVAVKGKLQWDPPYYWLVNTDGTKDGPFCQPCFVKTKELVHLHGQDSGYRRGYWLCTVCKNDFKDRNYDASEDAVFYRRNDPPLRGF